MTKTGSITVKILTVTLYGVIMAATSLFSIRYIHSSEVYQEYHKAVISLAAIFLAFSPAFYALLYSSPTTQKRIIALNMKDTLDLRFKVSTVSAFTLVILSLAGVILSYALSPLSEHQNAIFNQIAFILSIFALTATLHWTYLYGRLAMRIVSHLVR